MLVIKDGRSDRRLVKKKVLAEMFILQKGLAKFGEEGIQAAKKECSQMHSRVCFKAIALKQRHKNYVGGTTIKLSTPVLTLELVRSFHSLVSELS